MVSTPLQWINANEAIEQLRLPSAIIIVAPRLYNPEAFSSLPISSRVISWYIEQVPRRNEKNPLLLGKRFLRPYREVAAGRRIIFRVGAQSFDTLVLGHSRDPLHRHLANTIAHRQCILVDDGAQVLNVFREMELGCFHELKRPLLRHALDRFAGLNDRKFPSAELFTAYDPENNDLPVIDNEYLMIRRQLGAMTLGENEIWIIGQYFHQNGMMLEKSYFRLLAALVSQYYVGKTVRYIMHPREADSDSLSILTHAGVVPVRLKSAVELEMISRGFRPARIATFYSSVFQTCMKLFGNRIPFDIVEPPPEAWRDSAARSLVEPAYEYLRRQAVAPHRLIHPEPGYMDSVGEPG